MCSAQPTAPRDALWPLSGPTEISTTGLVWCEKDPLWSACWGRVVPTYLPMRAAALSTQPVGHPGSWNSFSSTPWLVQASRVPVESLGCSSQAGASRGHKSLLLPGAERQSPHSALFAGGQFGCSQSGRPGAVWLVCKWLGKMLSLVPGAAVAWPHPGGCL